MDPRTTVVHHFPPETKKMDQRVSRLARHLKTKWINELPLLAISQKSLFQFSFISFLFNLNLFYYYYYYYYYTTNGILTNGTGIGAVELHCSFG